MALKTRNLNQMMLKLLPYILQQEQIKQWLEKSRAEQTHWGEVQKSIQDRALLNKILGSLAEPEFFKEYPYSADTYVNFLKTQFPERAKGLVVPENLGDLTAQAEQAARNVVMAMQTKKAVSPEDIATMLRAYGYEKPYAAVERILSEISGEEERGLRGREIGVQEKALPIRKLEAETRAKEVGLKGKGKSKDELKEQVTLLTKKESVLSDQMESIQIEQGYGEGDPQYEELKTQRNTVRQQTLNILNQLLGEVDKQKAEKIIAKLRAGGAMVEALEKYKDRFMKEEGLTEEEYQYIKLNLR